MALWLTRAGKTGQHEQRFFHDSRIYLTWGGELQDANLTTAPDYDGIKKLLASVYPNEPKSRLQNWAGQIWAFDLAMNVGDWVVLPRKTKPALAIAEVTGPYSYSRDAEAMYRHSRPVKWLTLDVPRSAFDQDLLYSFGAFMTCAR